MVFNFLKMKKIFILLALALSSYIKVGAQEFIRIWPVGKMPDSKGMQLTDSISNERIHRVGTPGMYAFFPSLQENKHTAVLICPGGGYERLAYIISGTQLAKWFNTLGISAFVLNYRLPISPDLKDKPNGPLTDVQRALKYIRNNAATWQIDISKIGIMGTSAGGHLAAMAGTTQKDLSSIADSLDRFSFRPDFMILISPVIDMGAYTHKGSRKNLLGIDPGQKLMEEYSPQLHVDTTTPPAFIVHAFNDKSVNPQNSLLFYEALLKNNISSALHIFPQGGHAIALRSNPGSTQYWPDLCEAWLTETGFLQEKK
jgi:acetyl esterase/lipase